MNKFRLLFTLVLGFFLLATVTNLLAQTAKIKTQYKSSGNLGTFASNIFPIYSGNHTVAKRMNVYLTADTTGGAKSFSWTLTTKPSGSATTLSSSSAQNVTFIPDTTGRYIISLTVGTTTDIDTFWASTYKGPYRRYTKLQRMPCYRICRLAANTPFTNLPAGCYRPIRNRNC